MTQNAIFLAHSFANNDYDYSLDLIDAGWNRCFIQAFCIYYNTSYTDMKVRWNEMLKYDADSETVTIVSISSK